MMRLGRGCCRRAFSKRVVFGEECGRVIAETAAEVGRVAGITLGPLGRTVVIEDHKQLPRITRDGVTVVKHLERTASRTQSARSSSAQSEPPTASPATAPPPLPSSSQNCSSKDARCCRRERQCASSKRGCRPAGTSASSSSGLRRVRPIAQGSLTQQQQWRQVAMIATKGDRELSQLIVEAVSQAPLIKVERGSLPHSYVEFYGGVKVGAGLAHPEFKNHGDRLELDYPLVLLDSAGITSVEQVVAVLELAKRARKPLLLVSTAISDSVMSTLVYNLRKGIVQAYPLVLKDYGTQAQAYFQQLASTTGAALFDRFGPCPLTEVGFEHLGRAARVEMDDFETSVTGRSSQQHSNAVLYAGGATEAIALEVQDKLIDALNSVQTAKRHGVVAGGGVTYWRLADLLDSYDGPDAVGVRLLGRALRVPRRSLEEGREGGLRGEGWEGLNFKSGRVQDMFEAGVVDSAIVGESVLVDSVSLVQMLLDVSVCIVRQQNNTEGNEEVRLIEDSYKI